ncbi:hypothetical protein RDI58_027327 [Solanum bulbocastanum]|uniref:DUF4283 domain-containing protein n=1 Tax=Solanum bulbocastanum TaxID=147425 RepID=A0AAN8T0K6_SOLBU
MGEGFFLFEFASKVTAEQVVKGDWVWRNLLVKMQWWSPTVCASAGGDRTNAIWIRVVGLPLHFWEHHTFKAIEDFCVDGSSGEGDHQKTTFKAPVRRFLPIDGPKVFVKASILLRGAADKAIQPRAMADTVSGSKSLNATLGQLGQFSPNCLGKNKEAAQDGHMPFNEGMNEIKILAFQFLGALSHWESSSKLPQGENSMEKGPTPMKTQGEKIRYSPRDGFAKYD